VPEHAVRRACICQDCLNNYMETNADAHPSS
jgi:hypothetical protein